MKSGFKKWAMRAAIGVLVLFVYLLSTVPVGLFIYSLKSDIGLNVFSKTGFHAYLSCLEEQAKIATEGHE